MRKVNKEAQDFELKNLPVECQDPEIKQDDFVLTEVDGSIHEQKFQTKPTTFLKDSLRRFAKNKSSVVAAYILGFLILLSIFVPIFSPYDVSTSASDIAFYNLEPKLFNNANGFWDGTSKEKHVPVDTSTSPNEEDWYPNPVAYKKGGISNKVIDGKEYTTDANEYASRGYVEFGYNAGYDLSEAYLYSKEASTLNDADKFVLDLADVQLTVKNFETVDETKIALYRMTTDPILPENPLPENFVLGDVTLEFVFVEGAEEHRIPLTETKKVHNTGATGLEGSEAINVNQKLEEYMNANLMPTKYSFENFQFAIKVSGASTSTCALVKNLVIEATPLVIDGSVPSKITNYFTGRKTSAGIWVPGISFTDSNEMMIRTNEVKYSTEKYDNLGYWSVDDLNKYVKNVHLAVCTYASFNYDGYKGALCERDISIPKNIIESYYDKGWIDFDISIVPDEEDPDKFIVEYCYSEILDPIHCPLIEAFDETNVVVTGLGPTGDINYNINSEVMYYKYLGYEKLPSFLFGTDKTGRDMFKYVFEGLRNSLLLGVCVFVVCFIIGLAWGAISGYFGGTVDIVMERITDILSGLPWIVVMTLVVLKSNETNFGTFAFALCITGWIGTASLTRTQFYRFRGREYVLASRTLGASHARLITKHILPNAMGTIITSSVLMIPAIIFQEATISYLGLGFKNLSSLGVILSNNQNELTNHPYQLIFPSVVIALVMISFNLFGNGLRDAINPSLKGEDE